MPKLLALQAGPGAFLTTYQIKTGRGPIKISGATEYGMYWDPRANLYIMEPPGFAPRIAVSSLTRLLMNRAGANTS